MWGNLGKEMGLPISNSPILQFCKSLNLHLELKLELDELKLE